METLNILLLIFSYVILFVSSILHLYASFKNNKKLRNNTKGFILPSILVLYLLKANHVSVIVIIAIITSWVGDLLLIPKGTKWFIWGGISFMISHFFYIFAYAPQIDFSTVPFLILIPLTFIYYFIARKVFKELKPYLPKALLIPMILYLCINCTNNLFAWMQVLTNTCMATIIIIVGAVFFYISDSTLFLVRFHKKHIVPYEHFYVMLTYIIAEVLIAQGLALL